MTIREELAQEWRHRLKDFAVSEMTVQQWCDFNRVSLYQYYYWRRRLLPAKTQPAANKADHNVSHGRFVAVGTLHAPALPPTQGGVTIRIAGATIDVATGFDPRLLRAVVAALGTDPC